ncbi:phosphatase PAP2 family protein [Amycolatopsis sp. H20-H5]|uniref:phosphatase PAP2 family protein n=1 Tax=Amycolatopsis sp. H20-H5 TaxID=3046309 RepID=UPI002DC05906|nr:phosphatase PAP2 family protein [Amycolatopsis sp. H20-H5]MEC3980101.1 phosphatase PAP2 family protein [Amycolatopsis sp. H20-H5]
MSETSELLAEESLVAARRRSRAPVLTAAVCAAGFLAVYLLFVRTRGGQAFEFDVLQGAPAVLDTPPVLRARSWLAYVTEYAMAAVVVLILAVGLLRRRPALAVVGAGTLVVTALLDRLLVNWVFTRPTLVDDPANPDNSFPSGHVAMVMAALLGLLIVVPHAWRGGVALAGSVLVVGVAEMTMTVGWHRLSDTLGGNLLALGVASSGLMLVRRADPGAAPRWLLSVWLALAPLLGYGLWTVANAVGPAVASMTHDAGRTRHEYEFALFQAAGAIATTVSTLAVVAFVTLLAPATCRQVVRPAA